MTATMRRRVSSDTVRLPLRTYDTVLRDTPARRAISPMFMTLPRTGSTRSLREGRQECQRVDRYTRTCLSFAANRFANRFADTPTSRKGTPRGRFVPRPAHAARGRVDAHPHRRPGRVLH